MDSGIKLNRSFLDLELIYVVLLTGGATVFFLIEEWIFASLLLGGALCAVFRIMWKLYYVTLYGKSAVLYQAVPLRTSVHVRSKIYLIGFYLTSLWFFPVLIKNAAYIAASFGVNYSYGQFAIDISFWQDRWIQHLVDELAPAEQIPLIIPFCFLTMVAVGFAAAAGGLLGVVICQSMQIQRQRTWITALGCILGTAAPVILIGLVWAAFDWMELTFSFWRPLVCLVEALILLWLGSEGCIRLLEKYYRLEG